MGEDFTFHLDGSKTVSEYRAFHLEGTVLDTSHAFHLTGEEKEKPWTKIGTEQYWDATLASTAWNETPGSYIGTGGSITLPTYTEIQIVATRGFWRDFGTTPGGYIGSLGFKSAIKFVVVGPGSSLNYSETYFDTSAEAAGVWAGSRGQFILGTDHTFVWGFGDVDPTNNEGGLYFEVYAR